MIIPISVCPAVNTQIHTTLVTIIDGEEKISKIYLYCI